jgi:hypothetical protein
VTLGAEVVDLVGLNVVDKVGELFGVCEIAIMKKESDIR